MAESVHPRDWSTNWGYAVFVTAVVGGVTSKELLRDGSRLTASMIEAAIVVACLGILLRLGPGRGRFLGAFAVPLTFGLFVRELTGLEKTLGWWGFLPIYVLIVVGLCVPLDFWLRRRDRARVAS